MLFLLISFWYPHFLLLPTNPLAHNWELSLPLSTCLSQLKSLLPLIVLLVAWPRVPLHLPLLSSASFLLSVPFPWWDVLVSSLAAPFVTLPHAPPSLSVFIVDTPYICVLPLHTKNTQPPRSSASLSSSLLHHTTLPYLTTLQIYFWEWLSSFPFLPYSCNFRSGAWTLCNSNILVPFLGSHNTWTSYSIYTTFPSFFLTLPLI